MKTLVLIQMLLLVLACAADELTPLPLRAATQPPSKRRADVGQRLLGRANSRQLHKHNRRPAL